MNYSGEWEGQRGLEEEVKITTQPIAKRFMVKLAIFAVMSSALLCKQGGRTHTATKFCGTTDFDGSQHNFLLLQPS